MTFFKFSECSDYSLSFCFFRSEDHFLLWWRTKGEKSQIEILKQSLILKTNFSQGPRYQERSNGSGNSNSRQLSSILVITQRLSVTVVNFYQLSATSGDSRRPIRSLSAKPDDLPKFVVLLRNRLKLFSELELVSRSCPSIDSCHTFESDALKVVSLSNLCFSTLQCS